MHHNYFLFDFVFVFVFSSGWWEVVAVVIFGKEEDGVGVRSGTEDIFDVTNGEDNVFLEALIARGKQWRRFPSHRKRFLIQPWLFGQLRRRIIPFSWLFSSLSSSSLLLSLPFSS